MAALERKARVHRRMADMSVHFLNRSNRGRVGEAIVSYCLAILCAGAALVLTESLGKWAEPDFTALYVLAVLIASSLGGLGPGLLATVLSAAAIAYAQVGWSYQVDLGWDDLFRVAVFVLTAVIVSSLAAHRHAAEEQLQAAVLKLKQADRAKDEFVATISHELRTPLTSILGWASILGEGGLDAETASAGIDSIRQSAETQQRLIEDLLDMSRILFAKLVIGVRPVDLVAVVRSAGDQIRPAAESKEIELQTKLPLMPCVIEGDEHRIRQVVWNFLSNAVKFTQRGGRVTLSLEIVDSRARIAVSDTGEGIEAGTLPQVFDRFKQAEGAAAKGGLGLGLAIARHVMEAHRGSVEASSAGLGKGATFMATFPLAIESTILQPVTAITTASATSARRERSHSPKARWRA